MQTMETKKQEAIRKAYGEYWGRLSKAAKKCALNNNGIISPIISGTCGIPIDFITYNDQGFRPRTLAGIENNNGWIAVESDKDLPKDSYNYWLMCSEGRVINMKEYDYYKKYIIPDLIATHYQPIIKPLPPIY